MEYTKIDLFGKKKSHGSFDDFFSTDKYGTIEEAWEAEDYVTCDFVTNKETGLHIECRNVKNPSDRKYHRLNFQRPVAGIDVLDDSLAAKLAVSML